jgi:hypothetical protein
MSISGWGCDGRVGGTARSTMEMLFAATPPATPTS